VNPVVTFDGVMGLAASVCRAVIRSHKPRYTDIAVFIVTVCRYRATQSRFGQPDRIRVDQPGDFDLLRGTCRRPGGAVTRPAGMKDRRLRDVEVQSM